METSSGLSQHWNAISLQHRYRRCHPSSAPVSIAENAYPLITQGLVEYLDRFNVEFIERRQLSLQRFLWRILIHPTLSKSKIVETFLYDKDWVCCISPAEAVNFDLILGAGRYTCQ